MRRREFIALLGGVAIAWPLAVRAQQGERMRRIGVFMSIAESDPEAQSRVAMLRQELSRLGWNEATNLHIDYRWASGRLNLLPAYAAELARAQPDAILVNGTPALAAMRKETEIIPIVFVQVADPVAGGIVVSLAHPGGNVTGFTNYEDTMGEKWLELLKTIAPSLARTLVVVNPGNPATSGLLRPIQAMAARSGIGITIAPVHDAAEIERAFAAFPSEPSSGLIVFNDLVTSVHRDLIITLAGRRKLAAVYPFRSFVADGGLMSYGVDNLDTYRRAASYIDRILRGAHPEELPVQAPTKFELVINLKTAKVLGIDVPQMLLAIADEVIE